MNEIQYNSLASALLNTIPNDDALNIRLAVASLLHDDQLTDPRLTKLDTEEKDVLYSLDVPPEYWVFLRRPDDSQSVLEVVSFGNKDSIRKVAEAFAANQQMSLAGKETRHL
jgi:hypothetical protein